MEFFVNRGRGRDIYQGYVTRKGKKYYTQPDLQADVAVGWLLLMGAWRLCAPAACVSDRLAGCTGCCG